MATSNDIVLGSGIILISPTLADSLPADTTAKGSSWGGSWVDLGYTGGVSSSISAERHNVEVDQSTVEVRSFITKQGAKIEATLKEATLANLKYALGWGTLSTTGSTEVLTLGDNPATTEYSVGLEGQSPNTDAAFRRVQIYRCVPEPDIEMVMSRSEETLWKMSFKLLKYESGTAGNNLMQIRDYVD